jgi:hypothetical protein
MPLHRVSVFLFVFGPAVLAPACDRPELPMSPSALESGIILFEHANFLGNSAHITADIPDLRDFTGACVHDDGDGVKRDWNDCVSSIRVAPGWRATVYKDTGYRDDSLDVTEDVGNLQLVPGDCDHGGLNDCVSSVRVSPL